MKVFISTGFSGKTEADVLKRIEVMKKITHDAFCKEDSRIEWVHNYFYEARDDVKNPRIDCLGAAIQKMADCDILVLDEDYRRYKGCSIEKKIAETYNMKVYKIFYDSLAELFYDGTLD